MTPSLRSLGQSRGFTLAATLTLAAGLALCLIVAAVAHAYLVRPLPYPAADRLYSVRYAPPNAPLPQGLAAIDWTALDDLVEHPIAWDLDVFYLLGGAYPESAPGAWVTPGYLHAFGVRAQIGRDLQDADFATGRPMVALISHRLWHSRFGGDPAVIGRRLSVYVSDRPDEPETIEVVGVTRADFWHVNPYTDVIAPLRARAYPYLLQLREGVPPGLAEDRVTALVQAGASAGAPRRVPLVSFQAGYVDAVRPVLGAVGAAALLVLVIACANVAVLMLVRAQRRERDVALRLALGASRGQVLRGLLAEAAWVGGAATVAGLAIAAATLGWLVPLVEAVLERRVPGGAAAIRVDPQLAVVAVLGGLAATLAFALAPAAATWRQSLAAPLAGGRATGTPGRARARSLLIGLEVAVSLTLLTGALLMTASAQRMLAVDFGIRADGVTTASLSLRQQAYPDPAARAEVLARVLDRLAALTGSGDVAIGDWWPLQAPPSRRFAAADGTTIAGGAIGVTPGYFAALGMPVREGRGFTRDDRLGGEPVVVVSESLARRLWPASPAVGQTVRIATPAPDAAPVERSYRVIGVVADVRHTHTDTDLLDAYLPLLQGAGRFAFAYLPVPTPSPAWERELRQAVAALDPEIAVGAPRALAAALEQERLTPRVLAWLLSAFAVFAALLALLGMYGVIAYAVRQREREVAVRIAVGADRRAVTTLFVRQGGVVLAGGLLAGVLGAAAMGRALETQLHGVARAEPLVMIAAAVLLTCAGLAAIWWPARRAAATDPAAVLKAD